MPSTGQVHTVFGTSKLTEKYTHFAEKKKGLQLELLYKTKEKYVSILL